MITTGCSDAPWEGNAISQGSSIRIRYKVDIDYCNVGEDSMSLCFAVFYPFAAYIAADSRSSRGVGKINVFSNDYTKFIPDDDKYKKIFRLPFENKSIYGFSTGTNRFVRNSMDVTDIIKRCSTESASNLMDQVSHLSNSFYQKKHGVSFTLIEYDKDSRCFKYAYSTAKDNSIDIEQFFVNSDKIQFVASGSDWAKLILKYVDFPDILHSDGIYSVEEKEAMENNIVNAISDVFEKASKISCILDNSVGGEYHVLKLLPNGEHRWLYNGYDL